MWCCSIFYAIWTFPPTPSAKFLKRVSGRHLQKIRHLPPLPFSQFRGSKWHQVKNTWMSSRGSACCPLSCLLPWLCLHCAFQLSPLISSHWCFEINQQHLVIFVSLTFQPQRAVSGLHGLGGGKAGWSQCTALLHQIISVISTSANTPPRKRSHRVGNKFMTWRDWNEGIYTEEKPHPLQRTPESALVTVQWLMGGQV